MDEPRNSTESKEKLEGKITEGEVEVEKRNTSKGLFDSLFTVRPVSGPSLTAFGGSWPLIGRDGGLFEGEISSESPGGESSQVENSPRLKRLQACCVRVRRGRRNERMRESTKREEEGEEGG